MKKYAKKVVAGMIAGTMLLVGSLTVSAAQSEENVPQHQFEQKNMHRPMHHMKMDKEKAAQRIAEIFQVNKDEVLAAMNERKNFNGIGQAAMFAKISGKSFHDVMEMKTTSNHWKDVQQELGITQEQITAERYGFVAGHLAKQGNIDKDTACDLLKKGYQSKDIRFAAMLAKQAGKDIQDVLDMKKINNHWKDVAKELGIDLKKFEGKKGHGPKHKGMRDRKDCIMMNCNN